MNSFLIVGISRSGSTVLSSLIAEQYSCWNLGESWKIRNHHKDIRAHSISEQESRIDYLIANSIDWVGKIWATNVVFSNNLINRCLNNNIKVIFTCRKNILEHYNSKVYAKLRRDVLQKMIEDGEVSREEVKQHGEFFIFNDVSKLEYLKSLNVSEKITNDDYVEEFNSSFENFNYNLVCWRLLYEIHKSNITVVSYEDEIAPMNLNSVGINAETIERYNKQDLRYIKTPFTYDLFERNKQKLYNLDSFERLSYLMDVK